MTNKKSYSAIELAKMKLPHLPITRKGWLDLVKREDWDSVMVPGGKGCKGGLKREYYPSKAVAALIESAQNVDQEANMPKHYPTSTATHLTTGAENHTKLTAHSHSGNQIRVNNFVTVPKYDLPITSGERDMAIHSSQIVDHLAFKKEWLEEMSINNNCLALIAVKDDSMEPTLRSDDLILTDTSTGHIENNSIYVLRLDNELIVKRIQRKVNGSVIVKSDNPVYGEEEFDAAAAKALPVIGKVIWYGRRI